MVRDEVGRKADTVREEMALRGYKQDRGGTWVSKEYPRRQLSTEAANHFIAIRHDNFNDGFEAGLAWCMTQLRAYHTKPQAMRRIEEELNAH